MELNDGQSRIPWSTKLLDTIVDHLDIPKSYYEKAAARHKSLGEWLCRPESKVAAFQPHVSPQGSFRYGTVNRPLIATEEYDLDNVTTLADGEDRDDPEAAQGTLRRGDQRIRKGKRDARPSRGKGPLLAPACTPTKSTSISTRCRAFPRSKP